MTSREGVDQPGFRFNPTDEELITYYFPHKINGNHSLVWQIADIDNICNYEPWELPGLAAIQSSRREWYFSSPRNRERTGRLTRSGFWRHSGNKPADKIRTENQVILKRYLTFYTGRSSNRVKTNWFLHEYYLKPSSSNGGYVIYYLHQGSRKTIVNSVVDQGEPGHDSSSFVHSYQGSTHTCNALGDFSPSELLGSHHLENISDAGVFNNSLFDSCIEAAPGDNSNWVPDWWLEPASACSSYT